MNLRSFVNVKRITAIMRSSGSGESLILHFSQITERISFDSNKDEEKREKTYATKTSGRSRYCQYSRFGIGSKSEAGNERRLSKRNKNRNYVQISI